MGVNENIEFAEGDVAIPGKNGKSINAELRPPSPRLWRANSLSAILTSVALAKSEAGRQALATAEGGPLVSHTARRV